MLSKKNPVSLFYLTLIFQLLLSCVPASNAQQEDLKKYERKVPNAWRAMFYNVENLFDTEDDPLTDDQEFLPNGTKGWNETKYKEKLNNIYKNIAAIGGKELPIFVGLAEIENRKVLFDLIQTTPLRKYDYQIVHEDSPDARGIDVGFIYRPDKFKVIAHENMVVKMPFSPDTKTRDVLYVTGIINKKDTIHVFINHWPSRRGGVAASEPKRVFVAEMVKHKVDSIFAHSSSSNILIFGDFNDEPNDKSLLEGLGAKSEIQDKDTKYLYNCMFPFVAQGIGTEKYRGKWDVLDQIIVSSSLLHREKGIRVVNNEAHIFDAPWLLTDDTRNMGKEPFRTYGGPKYLGGYSDHLPVYIDLYIK